jgi:ferric-dicitrate binding protein FerR (iron transport regulator)
MPSDLNDISPEVRREAANWVFALYTCKNITSLVPKFTTWINRAPENRRAYLALEASWRSMRSLRALGRLENLESGSVAMDEESSSHWSRIPALLPRVVLGAVLCCMIAVGLAVLYWLTGAHQVLCAGDVRNHQSSCKLSNGAHAADYGETRQLDLVDGSFVTLNANSQVTLDMTDDHRHVQLDRGEALFKVRKNDRVPFEVVVDTTTVRAVGTVFSVEKKGVDSAETVVQEGQVELVADHKKPFSVSAGEIADIQAGNVWLRTPETSKVDGRLSWTTGLISLDGKTLAEAAERFNRTNRRQIAVDRDIADQPVGGLFSSSNPDGFADALEKMFGITHSISRDPRSGVETIRLSHKMRRDDLPHNTGVRNGLEEQQ